MAVRAQRFALQGCALIVVVLLASCASMSTALSIVLDASGEPEWNLPANGSDSWTYANQSNVYGGSYGLPTVHKAAGIHTEEACQAACDGDAAHEVDVRELWQPELGVPRCLQPLPADA